MIKIMLFAMLFLHSLSAFSACGLEMKTECFQYQNDSFSSMGDCEVIECSSMAESFIDINVFNKGKYQVHNVHENDQSSINGIPTVFFEKNDLSCYSLTDNKSSAICFKEMSYDEDSEENNEEANGGDSEGSNEGSGLPNAIRLVGIDLGMDLKQRLETLSKSGFVCKKMPNILNLQLTGMAQITCQNSGKKIWLSDTTITYSCENFNACAYSLKEIAQNIVNKGVVEHLEYAQEVLLDQGFDRRPRVGMYCGRGNAGDLLCIIERGNMFRIQKGALGGEGIRFN